MKDFFKSGHFWCRFVPLLWCVFNITVSKDCVGWVFAAVGIVDAVLLRCVAFVKDREKPEFRTFDKIFVAVLAGALAGIVLGNCARATTIIGDSHVGGLRPYLTGHMAVKYKNGSTAFYWLKHPVHDSTLIVMTGTNDRISGKSPAKWLKQTEAICRQARRCWIVSPPNVQGEYRTALKDKNNVIWSGSYPTRDGVHLYPSGYKAVAKKILAAVK